MKDTINHRDLQDSLDEALNLLRDYASDTALVDDTDLVPLPSLLAQCEKICTTFPAAQPYRAIHHLACSGGTLISKCLSVMPNVTLLSEIDPLSRMMQKNKDRPIFLPTDLIYAARMSLRPIDDATTVAMFQAALDALHAAMDVAGQYLVLRDHAHSQFCSDTAPPGRPTLHDIMLQAGPALGVVTVRHPLDCYLSLIKNKWQHFTPFTLDEYACRHIAFLERHAALPLFRYEDFVASPDAVMTNICAALDLPFTPGVESLISIVSITGDSGRSSNEIAHRPRRDVPDDVHAEIAESAAYKTLCRRLGYA